MKLNPILKKILLEQKWSKEAMDVYSFQQWQSILYANKVRIYNEFGVNFLQLFLAKSIVKDDAVSEGMRKFNQGLIDEATCNIQFASIIIAVNGFLDHP